MRKFSKREKTLIWIMIAVIIIFGSYFFVLKPQIFKIIDLRDEKNDLYTQKAVMKVALNEYDNEVTKNESLLNDIESSVSSFEKNKRDTLIEKFFTGMANNYSITVTQYSLNYVTLSSSDKKAETDNSKDTNGKINYINNINDYLSEAEVHISAIGTSDNLIGFLCQFEHISSFKVISYRISGEGTEGQLDAVFTAIMQN